MTRSCFRASHQRLKIRRRRSAGIGATRDGKSGAGKPVTTTPEGDACPRPTLHVPPDDLYAAAVELEQTGPVEWVNSGAETVVLIPPATNYD